MTFGAPPGGRTGSGQGGGGVTGDESEQGEDDDRAGDDDAEGSREPAEKETGHDGHSVR